jgi:hypothetical protein
MARRYQQPENPVHPVGRWDSRLELTIAVGLGLVAIVIAGSVYLNEKQEHKATVDFHRATHLLIEADGVVLTNPRSRQLIAASDREFQHGQDQQERATRYTLVEVILASSLFLLGVAGVARHDRVKIGAFVAAGLTFTTALVLFAGA